MPFDGEWRPERRNPGHPDLALEIILGSACCAVIGALILEFLPLLLHAIWGG
jgi:hypothetical protein